MELGLIMVNIIIIAVNVAILTVNIVILTVNIFMIRIMIIIINDYYDDCDDNYNYNNYRVGLK